MSIRRYPFSSSLRLLAMAVFALTFLLASCGGPSAGGQAKPLVLCTIFAYYDAARAIAKDTPIEVHIALPPGVSPHEYESSIADKVKAANAALYIKNGLGLDDRFDGLVAGTSAKRIVIADQLPKKLLLHTEEVALGAAPADHEEHAGSNPHIWLDPEIQIEATKLIRDAMISLAPDQKATMEKNAADYIADLEKLDADFKAAAANFKTKDFIGFHSAYDYLAHRYGLKQIASVEELPGEGLSPAQIQKITNLITTNHIRYVAVETALSAQGLKGIQEKTGVQTIVLQPIETYDDLGQSYVSLMRQNLEALKTALGTK